MDAAIARFQHRAADGETSRLARERFMSMAHKGWDRLGAFDAEERRLANDLLGFSRYILFPTPAFDQVVAAGDAPRDALAYMAIQYNADTDDPISRFERTLERTPDTVKQKFYTDNFADVVPAR